MKRYVRLFESFSEEQTEFLHKIGKRLGLHGHSDALELMLNYASKQLHTVPENISVKKIDKDELSDIMSNFQMHGVIDLSAFGVSGGGISRIEHGEEMTSDQYKELRDKIRDEHPNLYKEGGHLKNQKAFGIWMELRNQEAQKYGRVIATGPAGIFLLTVK